MLGHEDTVDRRLNDTLGDLRDLLRMRMLAQPRLPELLTRLRRSVTARLTDAMTCLERVSPPKERISSSTTPYAHAGSGAC